MYDGDEFIEPFLEDITSQTIFDNCELILINANSPGNEEKIINKPKYIYCKLDSTNLSEIHQLEQLGYQFSEFRINSLFDTYDTSLSINTLYPYIADIITEKSHLNNAIEILLASKDDDRFSKDPMIGLSFSKDRIVSNLKSHL